METKGRVSHRVWYVSGDGSPYSKAHTVDAHTPIRKNSEKQQLQATPSCYARIVGDLKLMGGPKPKTSKP